MRSGIPPAPRRRLNPKFREAVRAAMAKGYRSWMLAQRAGFPHQSGFSKYLHARRVRATPLLVFRFQRVAEAVDFRDNLFLPEAEGEQ